MVDALLNGGRAKLVAVLEASDFETQLLNSHAGLKRFLLEPGNIGGVLDVLVREGKKKDFFFFLTARVCRW